MNEHVLTLLNKVRPQVMHSEDDTWCWEHGGSGCYSFREGYAWLRVRNQANTHGGDWSWLWKIPIPEKVHVFMWLLMHQALPFNANRFRCHLSASESCSRCSSAREDFIHSRRDCPHCRELWTKMGAWSWNNFAAVELTDWVVSQVRGTNSVKFVVCLWGVWKWRNNMVLDPHPWPFTVAWNNLCREHDEFYMLFN